MKKIKSICIFIVLSIMVFSNTFFVMADDTGYYIKNYNVDVVVNDKRQCIVTETIDVYFNEKRHGIKRDIPTASSVEEYSLSDITVEGAPYEESDGYKCKRLTIGDKNETISGDKRYIIKYTMNHYADGDLDGDHLYLNLLGPDWDTKIENFTATVSYPKGAKINTISTTSGVYGTEENQYIETTEEENNIVLKSKNEIGAKKSVTLKVKFEEGAFKNAKELNPVPFIVESEITTIDINKKQEYLINKEYTIKRNNDKHHFEINLWNDDISKYNYSVEDVSVTDKNIDISDDNKYIRIPKGSGEYKFQVKYKVVPLLNSPVNLLINPEYGNAMVRKIKTTINLPNEYKKFQVVDLDKKKDINNEDIFEIDSNKKSIVLSNKSSFSEKTMIGLNIDMGEYLFNRKYFIANVTFILSIVSLILIVVMKIRSGRIRNIEIEEVDSPPKELNSAEMAYIANGKITKKDMATLITYWASDNHIGMIPRRNGEFTLVKISDLDEKHRAYEKEIFIELFSGWNGKNINSGQLKGKFYMILDKKIDSVYKTFSGEKSLCDSKSEGIKKLAAILSFIPPLLLLMIKVNLEDTGTISFIVRVILLAIEMFAIYSVAKKYNNAKSKYNILQKILRIFGIYLLTMVLLDISVTTVGTVEIDSGINIFVMLFSLIGIIIASSIFKRSDYGINLWKKVMGFEKFLDNMTIEKFRSSGKNNGEYLYSILPIVEVLGKREQWLELTKASRITETPDWYEDYSGEINIKRILNTIDSINRALTSIGDNTVVNNGHNRNVVNSNINKNVQHERKDMRQVQEERLQRERIEREEELEEERRREEERLEIKRLKEEKKRLERERRREEKRRLEEEFRREKEIRLEQEKLWRKEEERRRRESSEDNENEVTPSEESNDFDGGGYSGGGSGGGGGSSW